MSFTAGAVRRLVNIDAEIVSDEFIEAYADDGYTSAIDVAIALCDYMATRSVSDTNRITVGPITIQRASDSTNWQAIKKNLILRKNSGAGVPGGSGGLYAIGGATQTGVAPSQNYIGQFDNPPESEDLPSE